ncbi:MAG TPA: hypothetical protein VEI01_15830 [Terriglobales bacterium]|nr:hypothetical protein [Terriglobales bacterium]
MKPQTIVTLLFLFVLGISATFFAQTQITRILDVTVPFDFVVGSQHLAAGPYQIFHIGSQLILLQSKDGKSIAIAPVMVSSTRPGKSYSKLVFNRYGDIYILSQVWTDDDMQMHQCYRSAEEKVLATRMGKSATQTISVNR